MSSLSQKQKARGMPSDGDVVAALDIGSSKISCLIGRINPAVPTGVSYVGGGRQQSRGFRAGTITDMDALERSIRLAVEDAERQAGIRVDKVRLGITGPKVQARLVTAQIDVGGRDVGLRDVRRLQASALARSEEKGRDTLSAWPVAYRVNDTDGVREPVGMLASQVGLLMCVVSAPSMMLRNLFECVGRAHLQVESAVPSAIASGFGTLIEDERDNGAICIDMGAGVTALSMFLEGAPAWLDLVPVGGNLVTGDLAQGLGTTYAAAERLKTVLGQADLTAPGLAERIDCPCLGDDGRLTSTKRPRGDLAQIIAPRIEETFELAKARLDKSGLRKVMPRRIVLTGAASQLAGVKDVANRVFGLPVRLASPVHAASLGHVLAAPTFSTATGLLTYGMVGRPDIMHTGLVQDSRRGMDPKRMVGRTVDWLKENF